MDTLIITEKIIFAAFLTAVALANAVLTQIKAILTAVVLAKVGRF